jgi:Zn-dependent protease with chaperone function
MPATNPFSPEELSAMQAAGVTPPVISEQMLAYCHIRYALIFVGFIYLVLVLWALLQSGMITKLADYCRRVTKSTQHHKPSFPSIFCFYACLTIILTSMMFPLLVYSGFSLEHTFGLSNESFTAWFVDLLKAKSVSIVLGSLAFWILFFTINRAAKFWPIIAWAALSTFLAIMIFAMPLVFDPMFNRFTSMPAGELRTQIESLAGKANIANAAIFVVDKSKQTKSLNAYVTGLGSSTRIVIWDNTLNKMPTDQVLAVVGHEIGHYVYRHVYWGFALASACLFILLGTIAMYHKALLSYLPKRWQIESLTELSVIPVIMAAMAIISFSTDPIFSSIGRGMERQADAYGLTLTKNGPAMARSFVTLSEADLIEPDPPALIQFWFFNHPSIRQRIESALSHN